MHTLKAYKGESTIVTSFEECWEQSFSMEVINSGPQGGATELLIYNAIDIWIINNQNEKKQKNYE